MQEPVPRLILASTSKYRRELLQRLRMPFDVVAPATDESPLAGERATEMSQRLAMAKAQAVAVLHPAAIVIGSDQVAECAGKGLGADGQTLVGVDAGVLAVSPREKNRHGVAEAHVARFAPHIAHGASSRGEVRRK